MQPDVEAIERLAADPLLSTPTSVDTDDSGDASKRHPALNLTPHEAWVGCVSETGEYRFITSARRLYTLGEVKERLRLTPRPYADLAGRWADTDVAAFLAGSPAPQFSEVLARCIKVLRDAMEFPRHEHAVLVAVWAVSTYFYQLFLAFPRLNLCGEREAGKSKLMTILKGLAFNALLMLTPTPAVLYRLIQEFRPTVLLDEVEGLNKDDARDIISIINSGYKWGGTVPRCEGERRKQVELFQVYSPLALAAIKNINATTEDRCIPLTLQRGS